MRSIFKKWFKKDSSIIFSIIVLWIFLIILINPIGNFPFGDDFTYGKSVKILIETGKIKFEDWHSMTLIAHVLIGFIFCKLFGFSFTILRLVNLAHGLFGIIGVYFLSKEFGLKKIYCLICSLIIGFTPTYFSCCFTFSTDISFYNFMIWSIYFYILYFKEDKLQFYLIGIFLNVIALLIRDLAIVIPAAFLIGNLINNKFNRINLIKSILPLIVIFLIFILFRLWLQSIHEVSKAIDYSRNKILEDI